MKKVRIPASPEAEQAASRDMWRNERRAPDRTVGGYGRLHRRTTERLEDYDAITLASLDESR